MKKILLTVAMLLSAAGMQALSVAKSSQSMNNPLAGLSTTPINTQNKGQWVDLRGISVSDLGIAPIGIAPQMSSSNYIDCLPAGTSLRDEYAAALAAYEKCSASGQCQMAAPQRSIRSMEKYGPGHPLYEQYKACAIKNNQKPAAILYGR